MCWKLKLTVLAGCIDHLHVGRRVDGFNVRVDGLLDEASVQLSSTQLAPHRRFITALGKLVGSVQVPYVLYQYLQNKGKTYVMMHKGGNLTLSYKNINIKYLSKLNYKHLRHLLYLYCRGVDIKLLENGKCFFK